jgi:hypothetical protein
MADVIRYSEAFKLQVVDEIGRGKHASLEAALRAYEIKGAETIAKCRVLKKVVAFSSCLPVSCLYPSTCSAKSAPFNPSSNVG